MKRKRKTYMLSLDRDDPEKELEFEVAFQLTLTEKQRYTIMKKLVRQAQEAMRKNDHLEILEEIQKQRTWKKVKI